MSTINFFCLCVSISIATRSALASGHDLQIEGQGNGDGHESATRDERQAEHGQTDNLVIFSVASTIGTLYGALFNGHFGFLE